MIWTGISWKGKTNLVVLRGSLDTITYTDMLTGHLLPFTDNQYSERCVVQQENAPTHSAKQAKDYFMEIEITDMGWPPKSPDFNCIENCWVELSRRLYNGGRLFDTIEDLLESLRYEWQNLI